MTICGTVNKSTTVNRMRCINLFVVTKTTPRFPASASAAAPSAPVLHALLRAAAIARCAISAPAHTAHTARHNEGKRFEPKRLDPRLRRNPRLRVAHSAKH
jgi:hypothetical protein